METDTSDIETKLDEENIDKKIWIKGEDGERFYVSLAAGSNSDEDDEDCLEDQEVALDGRHSSPEDENIPSKEGNNPDSGTDSPINRETDLDNPSASFIIDNYNVMDFEIEVEKVFVENNATISVSKIKKNFQKAIDQTKCTDSMNEQHQFSRCVKKNLKSKVNGKSRDGSTNVDEIFSFTAKQLVLDSTEDDRDVTGMSERELKEHLTGIDFQLRLIESTEKMLARTKMLKDDESSKKLVKTTQVLKTVVNTVEPDTVEHLQTSKIPLNMPEVFAPFITTSTLSQSDNNKKNMTGQDCELKAENEGVQENTPNGVTIPGSPPRKKIRTAISHTYGKLNMTPQVVLLKLPSSQNPMIAIPVYSQNPTIVIPVSEGSQNPTITIPVSSQNLTIAIPVSSQNLTIAIPVSSQNPTIAIPVSSQNPSSPISVSSQNPSSPISVSSQNPSSPISVSSQNATPVMANSVESKSFKSNLLRKMSSNLLQKMSFLCYICPFCGIESANSYKIYIHCHDNHDVRPGGSTGMYKHIGLMGMCDKYKRYYCNHCSSKNGHYHPTKAMLTNHFTFSHFRCSSFVSDIKTFDTYKCKLCSVRCFGSMSLAKHVAKYHPNGEVPHMSLLQPASPMPVTEHGETSSQCSMFEIEISGRIKCKLCGLTFKSEAICQEHACMKQKVTLIKAQPVVCKTKAQC